MKIIKTIINGIEYSRDNSEGVFLVPVSKLGAFRPIDLPNSSSLHPTEIDFKDIDLYFSVTNANAPGDIENCSIFLLFSIDTQNYQEGSKRIYQIVNAISAISSKNYLDTPRIGVDQLENNIWKHYVTYMMSDKGAGNIIVKELADRLVLTLNNLKSTTQVFLCHSSEDKVIVEQFANRLKSSKHYVWFDKWEIKVGDSIVEKINDGLDTMTHLIIFLSKASVNKPWVKKELSSALMRKLKDNSVKVMPIKIDNTDIPTIISDIKYADCTEDLESGFNQLINDIIN
ncbi:MAG: toll/interleukin-1 receptor domain-containing protein [Bacteroidota bacterium]|jgi:hypothetical protein